MSTVINCTLLTVLKTHTKTWPFPRSLGAGVEAFMPCSGGSTIATRANTPTVLPTSSNSGISALRQSCVHWYPLSKNPVINAPQLTDATAPFPKTFRWVILCRSRSRQPARGGIFQVGFLSRSLVPKFRCLTIGIYSTGSLLASVVVCSTGLVTAADVSWSTGRIVTTGDDKMLNVWVLGEESEKGLAVTQESSR